MKGLFFTQSYLIASEDLECRVWTQIYPNKPLHYFLTTFIVFALGEKAITFLFKIIFYVAQGKKESHTDLERHECE